MHGTELSSRALPCHLGASVSSTEGGGKWGEEGNCSAGVCPHPVLDPLESEPQSLPRDGVTAAEFASHFAICEQGFSH